MHVKFLLMVSDIKISLHTATLRPVILNMINGNLAQPLMYTWQSVALLFVVPFLQK